MSALASFVLLRPLLAAGLSFGLLAAASAQVAADAVDAEAIPAKLQALARAKEAMLGVRSRAVDQAASIRTLGRERRGSGVLIESDGLVLTIGYLILEAEQVDLVDESGRTVPARVVAYDQASGFGLVQALLPLRGTPVRLGSTDALDGRQPLLIASGGGDAELSLARMVSKRAFSGYWEYHIERALFTVPARGDHSGAGLFNLDGELLGIGSLVVTDAAGPQAGRVVGNMFVPVDLLKPILAELRSEGASRHSRRAWLGLNCHETQDGITVMRVTDDGPADTAGVQPGDRILRIDGTAVSALEAFYKALWRAPPERDVQLTIRRGEQTQTLTLHAVDRMSTLRRPTGI